MKEQDVMHQVMLALTQAGARVFRQNVGQGYVGEATWIREPGHVRVNPGDVVVRRARVLHAGLHKGSADLIGWVPVEVTPQMVGRKLAVFLSPEVKRPKGGRRTPEQVNWEEQVRAAGGLAGFVRSPEEALALLGEVRS